MLNIIDSKDVTAIFLAHDEVEAKQYAATKDLIQVVYEYIEHDLRGKLKYGNPFQTPDEALEWARTSLLDGLTGAGISLDDLWR